MVLTLDSGTKRLLELASEPYRSDVQTILSIVNTVAPNLLDGMTEGSCNRIARSLEVRYPSDEVLFRKGDPPDAYMYYTVIRGAVSIYALSGDSIRVHVVSVRLVPMLVERANSHVSCLPDPASASCLSTPMAYTPQGMPGSFPMALMGKARLWFDLMDPDLAVSSK